MKSEFKAPENKFFNSTLSGKFFHALCRACQLEHMGLREGYNDYANGYAVFGSGVFMIAYGVLRHYNLE
jgi:hypothetical protein